MTCRSLGQCCWVLVFVVLDGGRVATSAQAQEQNEGQALRERLLREAPKAWEQYAVQSKKLQGRVAMRFSGTSNGVDVKGANVFHMKRNQRCRLLEASEKRSRAGQIDYDTLKVFGSNPNYAFELRRRTEGAPWVVTQLVNLKREKLPESIEQYFEMYEEDINCLVRLHRDLLLDLIRKPEFRILGCRITPQAGEELLEVSFAYTHEGGNPVQGGTLVLDPQRFWCLRSYQVHTQYKSPRATIKWRFRVLELGEAGEGLPVIKRAFEDKEVVFEDGLTNTQHWQFDYDLTVPQHLPGDEEFTLSAFGLPEPAGIDWKRPTPWWLYAGVAGVVCLVLAFVLRWLARCRATQRPTSS